MIDIPADLISYQEHCMTKQTGTREVLTACYRFLVAQAGATLGQIRSDMGELRACSTVYARDSSFRFPRCNRAAVSVDKSETTAVPGDPIFSPCVYRDGKNRISEKSKDLTLSKRPGRRIAGQIAIGHCTERSLDLNLCEETCRAADEYRCGGHRNLL
jgi:hypothetical protein